MKAANAKLNGEWCAHARHWLKKWTNKARRRAGKEAAREG